MSVNEHTTSTINVKEQIRLRNEEVKRKEEAQFRLVAKTLQKNESSGPSLSNLYSTLNSNYSIGGHYSSLKTKKDDPAHFLQGFTGKKHSSLYSLSSDNISGNINSNPNVLVLNCRDISSKISLCDVNEFSLQLNEPITDNEIDKAKMIHLSEYFKIEYNDALKDALRTINMERKFEQRRRKNQDERWESLIREGRGPSPTELELQRKDREKIDELSKNREAEVTSGVNKNFENKLNFEKDVKENMDSLISRWKGKQWSELIDFLEKGPKSEESSEEESEEEDEESSNNEESESEKEDTEEHEEEEENNESEIQENVEKQEVPLANKVAASLSSLKINESEKISSVSQTPQTGSLEVLNTSENKDEYKKGELKIEKRLKKSLQSLKPDIEEDTNIQNICESLNSVANENQEGKEKGNEEKVDDKSEEINKAVNDVEKSIQCMLQCNEDLQNELKQSMEHKVKEAEAKDEEVEKIEVIDVSENKGSEAQEKILDPETKLVETPKGSKEGIYESVKEQYNSKGSLTQINTSIIATSHHSLINNDSKSFIEIIDESGNKRANFDLCDTDDKINSAPPVLEDDKKEKLISPNTAESIKSINPTFRSQKTLKSDVPYVLKHQDMKALTYDALIYDYIKCKPRLSSECRSQVASEVVQMLDDATPKLMRASESTPLVAESGNSILKRIMKKLKKNKPNENKFDNEMEYQTINLFGSHLDILYDRYKDIPPFLKQCKKYIKARGLKKQGIFRISGRSGDIKELKHKFQVESDFIDIGRQVEIASKIKDEKQRQDRINFIKDEKKKLQSQGVYVNLFELNPSESSVASVFKLFFRELVEPLFTYRMYKLWIVLDEIHDKAFKIKLASHLILLLPFTHRLLLHYLLHFLSIVASYSSFNDMTSSNLAKVFGPSILIFDEKKKDNKASVELHEKANNVIEFLIDNYEEIFREGSELIITIENMIKEIYDEEDQNSLSKGGSGRSKSHFSISKVSKSQGKNNRNSGTEESKKSPLTIEDK